MINLRTAYCIVYQMAEIIKLKYTN